MAAALPDVLTDDDVPAWWHALDLHGRVVLGSDFPNIPSPYAHQLEALGRLREREPRLDDEWLRQVCWFTGLRLLG